MTVEGRRVRVDTRKAIALAAVLAVDGRTARDHLATLLWTESTAQRARAALRRTLSSLRTGVGPEFVASDGEYVALVGDVRCDVSTFDAEIAAVDRHGHENGGLCESCVRRLSGVTDLHRGAFLDGFSVRGAPMFEDWVRATAERLRLTLGDVLQRLSMAYAARGDYADAIAVTNRWIGLSELHEPAHRQAMLLHAWSGDRPGAVEAYRSFVAIVDRELGVTPLEETTELYEAILDEDLPPAPGTRSVPRSDRPGVGSAADRPLLDRSGELDGLLDAVRPEGGGRRVVSLTGGAWMGKTRLIDEMTNEARRDCVVLTARCFRMEQELPFAVVAQLLTSAHDQGVDLLAGTPPWVGEEAGRIDPGLAPGGGVSQTGPYGELRLFEALKEILSGLASTRRLLIAVDDAQWIDGASASLLAYVAERLDEAALTLVVARRSGEDLVPSLRRLLGRAQRIDLRPLRPADVAEVVEGGGRAERLIEQTGGVPLLVDEAITAGGGDGADTWSVVRFIESRLNEISALGRQVLSSAAVLGGAWDEGLLRSTSGRSDEEVVAAVEELIGAGLLREGTGGGLAFTLDALETLVYDDMTLVRRRLLHRRAGEALAERPASRTEARTAATTARQFRDGGDPRASDWYLIAGDLARSAYANRQARTFYEAALALGAPGRGALLRRMGELGMVLGEYERALGDLTAAAAHSDGGDLALVEHRLGEVHRLRGRFDSAAQHYRRAVDDHPQVSELYSDWSLLAHRRGHRDEAGDLAARAIDAAREVGEPAALSRAHNVAGVVSDDPESAMGHLEAALDQAGDHDLYRMAALNNTAHVLAATGEPETAIPLVEQAIEIADHTGHVHREAALRNHLADLYHRIGDETSSREAQTEAMALFADVAADEWEPELWLLTQW